MRPPLHTIGKTTANQPRKRVLIVNCYFDDSRQPFRRTTKIPQAVGPIYLAGAFSIASCATCAATPNSPVGRSKMSRCLPGRTCSC